MTTPTTPRRLRPALRWLAAPVLVAALAFAWWTLSPLFLSSRVDEAFPAAPAAQAPTVAADMAPAAAPAGAMPAAAMDDTMAPTAMADAMANTMAPTAMADAMDDAMAPTAAAVMADAMAPTAAAVMADAMAPTAAAAAPADAMPTAAPAAPAEPVALSSGSFTRIDRLHWAEGNATIYRLPDGSHVLRLEPFVAQNGPDLYVGLSGHPMPRSHAEAYDTGYIELDRLKANEGNQNYAIPAGVDVSAFRSAVIYCKAFSVVFSTAELARP